LGHAVLEPQLADGGTDHGSPTLPLRDPVRIVLTRTGRHATQVSDAPTCCLPY
jgi:hypothetical protein